MYLFASVFDARADHYPDSEMATYYDLRLGSARVSGEPCEFERRSLRPRVTFRATAGRFRIVVVVLVVLACLGVPWTCSCWWPLCWLCLAGLFCE